jgi:hypothetical protein
MKRTVIISRMLFLAPLMLAIAFSVACGSDDSESSVGAGADATAGPVRTVEDNGRIYTIDDIKATGAKTPRQYDVTDLPGSVDAWRVIFNQKDYEVRLYGSYSDAVSQGTIWAEGATGEDAVVVGDGVMWEEGAKDRRQCNRSVAHSGCNYTAHYGDFVIIGNMVLMCEGPNSEEALLICGALLQKLS